MQVVGLGDDAVKIDMSDEVHVMCRRADCGTFTVYGIKADANDTYPEFTQVQLKLSGVYPLASGDYFTAQIRCPNLIC